MSAANWFFEIFWDRAVALYGRYSAALFALGVGYGSSLYAAAQLSAEQSLVWDNLLAVLYILFSTVLLLGAVRSSLRYRQMNPLGKWQLVFLGMASPVGLTLAAAAFGTIESYFWVSDSVNTHQPSALHVVSLLRQLSHFQLHSDGQQMFLFDPQTKSTVLEFIMKPGAVTHLWVGFWYYVLGVTRDFALVETFSLLLLKGATLFFIMSVGPLFVERLGFDDNGRSQFVVLPYILVPSVLFHTMAFYKEAMVHLFVAAFLYGVLRTAKSGSLRSAILVLICFLGLIAERFYVASVFLPVVAWAAIEAFRSRRLVPALLVALAFSGIFYFRREAGMTMSDAIDFIKKLREHHSAFNDVSHRFNYEIPYVVALVKTLMTPIWAPDKMAMFRGPSALITWGSFLHQFTMVAYVLALVRIWMMSGWRSRVFHIVQQTPLILFVAVAAYVSPWAGRIRDSFYPLITVYAALYIGHFWSSDRERILAFMKRIRLAIAR